jgi:hypothetical protein
MTGKEDPTVKGHPMIITQESLHKAPKEPSKARQRRGRNHERGTKSSIKWTKRNEAKAWWILENNLSTVLEHSLRGKRETEAQFVAGTSCTRNAKFCGIPMEHAATPGGMGSWALGKQRAG